MKYVIAIDGPDGYVLYLCNYSVCARVISETTFTRFKAAAPRFEDREHAEFIAGHKGSFFLHHSGDLYVVEVPA